MNDIKKDLIDNVENLKLEIPSRYKSYLDGLIKVLKKENLKGADIVDLQDKIEEICQLDVDPFVRNELYNIISLLEELI